MEAAIGGKTGSETGGSESNAEFGGGEEAPGRESAIEGGAGGEGAGGRFFGRCLAQNRGATAEQQRLWRSGVYGEIRTWNQQAQGEMTVERMCQVVMVSRAGYYRFLMEKEPEEEEMEVRAAVQEVFLQHRGRYGRPRITAALRSRGMIVNHKRVGRLMRLDNLLAIGRRQFVRTTDSAHGLEVSLNMAAHLQLTGVDQLWVADITYIRLRGEFVFLAVV